MKNTIAIMEMEGGIVYPKITPFDPPKKYPEAPFDIDIDTSNKVYPLVRDMFYQMGFDNKNYGKTSWNPLGSIINPGGKVVIKPNWVLDKSEYDINALIAHMSVIRAIVDYAWKACGPNGHISILESPIQNTDWKNLMKVTGAEKTVHYLKGKGVSIDIQDIRTESFVEKDVLNIFGWRLKTFYRKKRPGTKKGYKTIDLKSESALDEIKGSAHLMRSIQRWTARSARKAHNSKHHKYSVPREILECDAFINVPKLKTHRKAGVTLSLKNLVGMVEKKEWLPHYLKGTPKEGGDECPRKMDPIIKFIDNIAIVSFFKRFGFSIRPPKVEKMWRKKIESDLNQLKNVRQANWYGGDTVCRMVYDLNMILLHADKEGKMHEGKQRNYLSIIDGIISGEKFGPLNSIPKKTGVIIGGFDPVLTEFIGTRVMGFDEKYIKTLDNLNKLSYSIGNNNFEDTNICTNNSKWKEIIDNPSKVSFSFIPAPGWTGHIEWKD